MAAVALPVCSASAPAALQPSTRSVFLAQRLPRVTSSSGRVGLASRQRTLRVVASAGSSPALGAQGNGNVKEIQSRSDWETFLAEAGARLVVVDVATRTCGPCKFIYPKVVQLSLDYPDVVFLKVFGDLNDETRSLMREWGVRAVPQFRFYLNGELVHSHTGAKEEELKKNLQTYHSQSVPA